MVQTLKNHQSAQQLNMLLSNLSAYEKCLDQQFQDLNYNTLLMRQNEKAKTSVFSEYQNNQNDSISSRQLEFWLKQTAPQVQPKFSGNQWTLMSTNSIFQQEEHTLQRNQTFQTINKENDYLSFNSARPTLNNTSSMLKSKSYVNAMVDLQTKIKHLQSQNQSLKQSLNCLRQQRSRTVNESTLMTEQLKSKLQSLQPKAKRIDQLVKQNKRLRDLREQNNKKTKILQKMNKEKQSQLAQYERSLQGLKDTMEKKQRNIAQLQAQNAEQRSQFEKNRELLQKLQQKNKMLEGMKEKSTSSILQKYNRSVQMVEELTTQNMKLKQQTMLYKDKHEEKSKSMEERYRNQREECVKLIEKLKQQLIEKKQSIISLNKDSNYFKESYEQKNSQLIKTLRDHAAQIKQIKTKHQKEAAEWRQKTVKLLQNKIEKKQQMLDLNRESMIKIKQQEQNYQIQSQIQFQELNSVEQTQQAQQAPKLETRSLDKKTNKHSAIKSIVVKPIDSLSQKDSKNISIQQRSKVKMSIQQRSKAKMNSAFRQSKVRRKSHEKPSQKSKEKSKSRQVVEGVTNEHENSFILKSCEPITQQNRQPYFYNSANNPSRNNIPYYWQPNEIPEFAISQRGNYNYKQFALEEALLMEANRQGIRLIQQQEKCINLLNENVNPTERAENLGRMKQIGEQIRLNSEKILELKLKISGQLKN